MTPETPPQLISVSLLKPHPRQRDFFSDTPEIELAELARDLQKRGQQEPIHVSPDFTLVRGHRRVQAAQLLGWSTIRAVVRSDLGDVNSPQAIRDLISDNVQRRQLDALELARCYRELKVTESQIPGEESGDLRDRLAVRLRAGKSGRTLDRLERLLQLPRDIQDMISTNRLNKHQAEKILKLPLERREPLLAELRAEQPVADVLRRHGLIAPARARTPSQLGEELLRFLQAHLKTLQRSVRVLDTVRVPGIDTPAQLSKAAKLLQRLADRRRFFQGQSSKKGGRRRSVGVRPDKVSGDQHKNV